jgi:hypothetical protein
LLGPEQRAWLHEELRRSAHERATTWRVIGQQVPMVPLAQPFTLPDKWDGYPGERTSRRTGTSWARSEFPTPRSPGQLHGRSTPLLRRSLWRPGRSRLVLTHRSSPREPECPQHGRRVRHRHRADDGRVQSRAAGATPPVAGGR